MTNDMNLDDIATIRNLLETIETLAREAIDDGMVEGDAPAIRDAIDSLRDELHDNPNDPELISHEVLTRVQVMLIPNLSNA